MLHAILLAADLRKKKIMNNIRVSNSLDQIQAGHYVWRDIYWSKQYLETKVATSQERDIANITYPEPFGVWTVCTGLCLFEKGSTLFVLAFACLRRGLHCLYWPLSV